MNSTIFISYRRGDSIATAGRIRDRLVRAFGEGCVFVDIDGIGAGQDFVKVLEEKMASARVLLAIIGPGWLSASDAKGQSRLYDPKDFVGLELATALQKEGTRVIPVLVDGAKMPDEAELPEALRPLTRRNAIELRNTQFNHDAERLVHVVQQAMGGSRTAMLKRVAVPVTIAAVLGAGAFLAWPSLSTWINGAPAAPVAVAMPPRSEAQPKKTEPPVRVAATITAPGANAHPSPDVGAAIDRLSAALAPAKGRVTFAMRGGNRIKLGDQISFEAESEVAGRLILIDVNAEGEVTQIFPNRFVASEAATRVAQRQAVVVPGPGYGFSSFKAVEPAGRGRLIAVVVPDSVPADRLAMVESTRTKGFEPVNAATAYFDQLIVEATGSRDKAAGKLDGWAFAVGEYEIVR